MKKARKSMKVWTVCNQDGTVIDVFSQRPTITLLRKFYDLGTSKIETEIIHEMMASVRVHECYTL